MDAVLVSPGTVYGGDLVGVLPVEGNLALSIGTAQATGVDEERVSTTVSVSHSSLVPGQDPEANRDAGVGEEPAWQAHDAVHEVGLDQPLPDGALTGPHGR